MIDIFFFTLSVEHTTHRKAAQMLKNSGANVVMAGFTRNNFPATEKNNYSITVFGRVVHGNYIKRLIKLVPAILALRREARKHDVMYCFTLDAIIILRIAMFGMRRKWVYQVQDIRPIFFGERLKNKFVRFLEENILRKVDLVVLSSEEYFTGHFQPSYLLDRNKIEVIENKIDRNSIGESGFSASNNTGRIVFGYFGVLRCVRSWEILYELCKDNPDSVGLYIRGKPDAMPSIENEVKHFENVEYGGLYRSPDDLSELYGTVDLVWACYPYSESDNGNWRMARTIRYYEALAFGKPVIVQKGTAQAKDVARWNIGLAVDMAEPARVKSQLSHITVDDIAVWRQNIAKLDSSHFFHVDEHKKLLKRICNL